MGFLYWFGPYPSDAWHFDRPENDQAFSLELYNRSMLCLKASRQVELLCDDASQLSSAAFDAFLNPELNTLCGLVVAVRFRHFEAANARALVPLVEKLPHIESLEILKGFTLDRACIDVLSRLPKLEELAVDGLQSTEELPSRALIADMAKLKSLRRFAVPRCFLLEHEIDAVIETCHLEELAVANAYDEDGQQAIQEKHEYCKIDWGYMI